MYNSYTVFMDYYNYPVLTQVTVSYERSLPFPAVTVCNLNPLPCTNLATAFIKQPVTFKDILIATECYEAITKKPLAAKVINNTSGYKQFDNRAKSIFIKWITSFNSSISEADLKNFATLNLHSFLESLAMLEMNQTGADILMREIMKDVLFNDTSISSINSSYCLKGQALGEKMQEHLRSEEFLRLLVELYRNGSNLIHNVDAGMKFEDFVKACTYDGMDCHQERAELNPQYGKCFTFNSGFNYKKDPDAGKRTAAIAGRMNGLTMDLFISKNDYSPTSIPEGEGSSMVKSYMDEYKVEKNDDLDDLEEQKIAQTEFLRINVYFKTLNLERIQEVQKYDIWGFLSSLGGATGLYLGLCGVSFLELFEHLISWWLSPRAKENEDAGNQSQVTSMEKCCESCGDSVGKRLGGVASSTTPSFGRLRREPRPESELLAWAAPVRPMANKLAFRARAPDAAKPLPIYHVDEIPDLVDAAINRAVPPMPTGMEKNEECEHHLLRAISARQKYGENADEDSDIPIPDVLECPVEYASIYSRESKIPKDYIRVPPFSLEPAKPDYDLDSDDERWFKELKTTDHTFEDFTELTFEEMIDRLEKGSGQSPCTLKEARMLLNHDDDLIVAVYNYWTEKRSRLATSMFGMTDKSGAPLVPPSIYPIVLTSVPLGSAPNNPYVAFRKRTEKMQTRKNRKNDEYAYERMVKLRRDLMKALTLLEMVKRREKLKREYLNLTVEIIEKRYQLQDWGGKILREVLDMKPQKRAASRKQVPMRRVESVPKPQKAKVVAAPVESEPESYEDVFVFRGIQNCRYVRPAKRKFSAEPAVVQEPFSSPFDTDLCRLDLASLISRYSQILHPTSSRLLPERGERALSKNAGESSEASSSRQSDSHEEETQEWVLRDRVAYQETVEEAETSDRRRLSVPKSGRRRVVTQVLAEASSSELANLDDSDEFANLDIADSFYDPCAEAYPSSSDEDELTAGAQVRLFSPSTDYGEPAKPSVSTALHQLVSERSPR
ncbi:unnamed protein product [Notodromas monacha]|uniref:Enhancer of polycomb-like protein n=1 Tax=Notodromas monacha TaxID=399045 RepID=A0A7R9GCC9_9CRUS|nr:unnamed protein product [Notodromas monacha]CAG0915974.1 unnamed protein product [Notodromas monacha]